VTAADLKKLNISGSATLAKMLRWGWCDDAGRPLLWEKWINRKHLSDLGRTGMAFRNIELPAAKSEAEKLERKKLTGFGRGKTR
jgi:hypothetical protein